MTQRHALLDLALRESGGDDRDIVSNDFLYLFSWHVSSGFLIAILASKSRAYTKDHTWHTWDLCKF